MLWELFFYGFDGRTHTCFFLAFRSPCHNDKCLFKTSIDPFPDPKEVVFYNDLQSIDEQNQKFYALDFPSNEFWNKFSFINAVDHDPTTCWNSYKSMCTLSHIPVLLTRPVLLCYLCSLWISFKHDN